MRYEGFQNVQQLFGRLRLGHEANIVGIRQYLGHPNVKELLMVRDNDVDQDCTSALAELQIRLKPLQDNSSLF